MNCRLGVSSLDDGSLKAKARGEAGSDRAYEDKSDIALPLVTVGLTHVFAF